MLRKLSVLSLIALAIGLVGCPTANDPVETPPPPPAVGDDPTGTGDPGDPTGEDPTTGGDFSLTMGATECDPNLPDTVSLQVSNLTAVAADTGELVTPSPESELTVDLTCGAGAVSATVSGTQLPAGDYSGIDLTITGVRVDGQEMPLPGDLLVRIPVAFTVTEDGLVEVELLLDVRASFVSGALAGFQPVFRVTVTNR